MNDFIVVKTDEGKEWMAIYSVYKCLQFDKAHWPAEMLAATRTEEGAEATEKFILDCESLIKKYRAFNPLLLINKRD